MTLDAVEIKQAAIQFFAINYREMKIGRVQGCLSSPFFSKIMKYDEFSIDIFVTWMDKLKLWLKTAIQSCENESSMESERPQDDPSEELDKEILTRLNDIYATVKEVAKGKNFSIGVLEPFYEQLHSFREKARSSPKLSSDS